MAQATYLNETLLPLPFCPGCGHSAIVEHLNTALVQLQLDPHDVVIVTDIGCQGLSDKYFTTNAFHGLHGRSVTYATGIKLANPDLKVIVLMGDGGCGIGGHHLLNAARRNIGISVLVFNNLNFGMTGGEHSVTTPSGGATVTTRYGHLERPLNICETVRVNGANFVARTTTFDKTLPDLIVRAIQTDGFSLIDIWELCTAYYVPNNKFNRKLLEGTLDELNYATGVICEESHPEYSRAYRDLVSDLNGQPVLAPHPLETRHRSPLTAPAHVCVAGAAGKKINTAAGMFAQGAILSGLWATQRNDYPVTVKTGHSVSDVVLSPAPGFEAGLSLPDVMVLLSPEGLKQQQTRLAQLSPHATVFVHADLLPITTPAQVFVLDFAPVAIKAEYWGVMALAEVLRHLSLYPVEAFADALALRPAFAAKNQEALAASEGLARRG